MSKPEKFCSACQRFRPIDFGQFFVRNKIKRWICQICQERQNQSLYASKKRDEKAKQVLQTQADKNSND